MSVAKLRQTIVTPGDYCQYYCASRGVNKFIGTNTEDEVSGCLLLKRLTIEDFPLCHEQKRQVTRISGRP